MQFKRVFETDTVTIDISMDESVLRINGVDYAIEFFDHIADPDPSKLYTITKDGYIRTIKIVEGLGIQCGV